MNLASQEWVTGNDASVKLIIFPAYHNSLMSGILVQSFVYPQRQGLTSTRLFYCEFYMFLLLAIGGITWGQNETIKSQGGKDNSQFISVRHFTPSLFF